MEVQNAGCVG